MRIGARDQARVQQTWQCLISCIARPPGHFVRSILARERGAHQNWWHVLWGGLNHAEKSFCKALNRAFFERCILFSFMLK
jgi:hypothetical protein